MVQHWEKPMRLKPSFRDLATVAIAVSFAVAALAQGTAPTLIALTAEEMKWSPQGTLALPGLEQVSLVGDPSKPGPYTIRLKFPAGFKLAPHTHPDQREVTILSGTWYTGYGEQADPALLKALPAGSFYTEPANLPHFVEVRDAVVIQVSGIGPSGRAFVGAQKAK
jgi:quercetin dioxygenase-like cupin family protein